MFYVTNGKLEFGVATENQLSPFLANGYKLIQKDEPVIQPIVESEVEPIINYAEEEIVEEIVEEEKPKYSRRYIERLNKSELTKLAIENDIDVAPTATGSYLKKALIETLIK